MQQYNENYGFDVKKSLEEYKIAELSDPKKMDRLIEGLKDGERMSVTVEKDGKEMPLKVDAMPRYSNLNFFSPDSGKPVKREELQIQQKTEKSMGKNKEHGKGQEMAM
ncbi:hypothetical protein [Pedobacter antarcticus]|uniref:hypothetical protein n=1 Tax=Pedobacter antarcticus TaxID=34086 RepID=UPI00292D7D6E|nr:hypothetical protein [Pedobacter antarcticus]